MFITSFCSFSNYSSITTIFYCIKEGLEGYCCIDRVEDLVKSFFEPNRLGMNFENLEDCSF